MIIALDYDKTYTLDQCCWNDIIYLLKHRSHKVICITMRYPHEPIMDMPKDIQIYYTSRHAKLVWAKQNNIHVDIWIDDNPAWLFDNAGDCL